MRFSEIIAGVCPGVFTHSGPISAGADAPQRIASHRSWVLSVLVKPNAHGSSERMKASGQLGSFDVVA